MNLKQKVGIGFLTLALTASPLLSKDVRHNVHKGLENIVVGLEDKIEGIIYGGSESIGKKYSLEPYRIKDGDRIINITKDQYLSDFTIDYNKKYYKIDIGNLEIGSTIYVPKKNPDGKTIREFRKEYGLR